MATVTGNPLDKKVEMANTEKVRKPQSTECLEKISSHVSAMLGILAGNSETCGNHGEAGEQWLT